MDKRGKYLIFLPKKWRNDDVFGALCWVVAFAVIGVIISSISGCYGFTAHAEYEHHSSVPNYRDLNTTDQIGLCGTGKLTKFMYSPTLELCLHREMDMNKPVFGDNPVGTARVKFPLYLGGQ